MAPFEPFDGEPEQATRDVRRKAKADGRARHQQHERTQQARPSVDQREQPEADCQHRQQIGIERRQGLIDRKLHVIGRGQHEGLQHQRQHQNLQQRTLDPGYALPELR